jgi:hypothetical protein
MSHPLVTLGSVDPVDVRMVEERSAAEPGWPVADVVVLPGLPGWHYSGDDDRLTNPFPTTTTDIVKVLRSDGLTVEHIVERDHRQEVSLNAAEYWVPVLVFAADVGANMAGDLLAGAITRLFGAPLRRRSRLHVRYGQQRSDGSVDFFEAHGDAEKVIEAIRAHANKRGGQRQQKRKKST